MCVFSTIGRYRILLPLWKSRRAISIQNIARQFLARKKVAGIHHEHLEEVKQQKVRGHRMRLRIALSNLETNGCFIFV